jgi:3-hydroxybutyrate dehydrogenase
MRLQDQVVVVTGGASGIGYEIAKRFAAEGAAVVIADLNLKAAEKAVAEIEFAGGQALAVQMDVIDENEVDSGSGTQMPMFVLLINLRFLAFC